MRKLFPQSCLFIASLCCHCSTAGAATHCSPDEAVFFSCRLAKSEKVVSLCGRVTERGETPWVQYRFGRVGKPEMVFPKSTNGSLEKFGGVRQTTKAVGLTNEEVWFRAGSYSYLIAHSSGGDCEGECQEQNNLTVFKSGSVVVAKFSCVPPVSNDLSSLRDYLSDDQSDRP